MSQTHSRWIAVVTSLSHDPIIRHGATKAEVEAAVAKIAEQIGHRRWETNGCTEHYEEIRW